MKRNFFTKAVVFGSASLGLSSAFAAAVATVNGVAIDEKVLNLVMQHVSSGSGSGSVNDLSEKDKEQFRRSVLDFLVRSELIAQHAREKGLDKNEEYKVSLSLAQQEVLLRAYTQEYFKVLTVSEEELRKQYEELVKTMAGDEYHIRHILVESEEEAKKLYDQLKKGSSNFDDLAKKHSKDPGSAQNGGDMGWNNLGIFVPEFGDAAKALGGSGLSKPVKTQFGYHVLEVMGVRKAEPIAFEAVRVQLENMIKQEKFKQHVEDMKEKAKVVIK